MAFQFFPDQTEDQPIPLEAGAVRFDTASDQLQYYTGTAWISLFSVGAPTPDTGQGTAYSENFPAPGVDQSSEPFRLNFTVIRNSLVNLQRAENTIDSVITLETLVSEQSGAVTYRLDWKPEGLVIPDYRPEDRGGVPGAGALRFDPLTGRVEYWDGSFWNQLMFERDTAMQLPTGTTEQRPDPASPGMIRFNTTSESVEIFNGDDWLALSQRTQNQLFVNKSGSDEADGRSASESLRTIREACRRARDYLLDGTFEPDRVTIFIGSGDYEEICPITVPPGVSIIGDSLRAVTVRPTVATSDVFLLNSSTYVYGLTVRGHRLSPSALEVTPPGFAGHIPWTDPNVPAPNLNTNQTGWAFRFAPGTVIRVSPYIQNCSSISGSGVFGTPDFVPGGGGVLCDPTDTGPDNKINSIVVDAFTQINLGGIGVKVANGGYMQLVSFFKNFCQIGVLCTNGGHATLLNSNCSFGNYALWADGARVIDPIDDYVDAQDLIRRNREFLQDEVVAFVNATYPSFVYDQAKCRRDVGLILDALSDDLLNGNTLASLRAGNSYWNGMTSFIPGQQTQTIAALNYLMELLEAVLGNRLIKVTRDTEARELLRLNKAFLQAEVVEWVNQTYPLFVYDEEKCSRDVGFIVEALRTDLVNGDDFDTIRNANAYWFGNTSAIPTQKVETLAAIERLEELARQVVANVVVADTLSAEAQVTSVTLDGSASQDRISDLLWLFRAIARTGRLQLDGNLVKGPNALATFRKGIALITSIMDDGGAYFAARSVIGANRDFLAAEVTAYVDLTYPDFQYNRTVCARDVGLILDALMVDLQLDSDEKTIEAANAYWVGTRSVIIGQTTQTKAALDYLSLRISSLLQGQAIAPLQPLQPVTANTPVTDAAMIATLIDRKIEIIKTVMDHGRIEDFTEASLLLEANRAFLQDEIIAFVDTTFPVLVYDEIKCRRDVGFMIDAIRDDIAAGNTDTNSITAGNFYWTGTTNVLDPGSQKTETVAALRRLRDLMGFVVRNEAVPALSQTAEPQVFDANLPLARAGDRFVQNRMDTIIDIVETGGRLHQTRIVLESNRTYLQREVTAWVDATYPSFNYDRAACQRDVGFIIDALLLDILRGDSRKSIEAGNAYWNGMQSVIQGEIPQTLAAVSRLSELIETLLALQSPISTQLLVLPTIDPTLTSAIDGAAEVVENLSIIKGIMSSGPSDTTETFGSLIEASGYTLSYAGAGIDYSKLSPSQGGTGVSDPNKYTITRTGGEIFSTITDENGDFYVGPVIPGDPPSPNFRVSQRRAAIDGRSFYQSIFGFMAPFIMALTRR